MARPLQANIDFSGFTEAEFSPKVHEAINALITNATLYSALIVDTTTLDDQIDAYDLILGTPLYDGKAEDLFAARKIVETSMRKNGVYINQVADGDPVKLEKSGYPISKEPAPIGPLGKTRLEATSIPSGFEVEITDVTPGYKGFIVLTVPAAGTPPHDFSKWNWNWLSKRRGRITGLDSSVKYRLVSVAVGTDPTLNFSDFIERTTQ